MELKNMLRNTFPNMKSPALHYSTDVPDMPAYRQDVPWHRTPMTNAVRKPRARPRTPEARLARTREQTATCTERTPARRHTYSGGVTIVLNSVDFVVRLNMNLSFVAHIHRTLVYSINSLSEESERRASWKSELMGYRYLFETIFKCVKFPVKFWKCKLELSGSNETLVAFYAWFVW